MGRNPETRENGYSIVTDASPAPVRAVRALHVGPDTINALAITSADTAQMILN